MSERRNPWYILITLALLLTPFAIPISSVQAAGVYTVDKLTDDPYVAGQSYCNPSVAADCSLRQAVKLAETDGVASSISFKVGMIGVITLDTVTNGALVLAAGNTTIQAPTTPFGSSSPPIEIAGVVNGNPSSDPAFTITSSGNTIKGLSITGFNGLLQPQGAGIFISGATTSGNIISGNYIGVKPDGVTLGANVYGIRISSGSAGNTISGNIIVGSQISGVFIENANGNTLTGNLIGLGLNSVVLPNNESGIEIISSDVGKSTNNTIGGLLRSEANFISSNGPSGSTIKAGILLRGTGTISNTIRSNMIGTDIGGIADLGNRGDGIRIASGASNNTIVGTTDNPVVISGNSGYGIRISGATTLNNQISGGVFVGVNSSRDATLANDLGGIMIDQGANGTTVSGSNAALTLIGGNTGPGVTVNGLTTVRNQISNAYIGAIPNPTVAGTITAANTGGGILVNGGAQYITLSSNTISGNGSFGIQLDTTKTVTVTGNVIGLDTSHTGTIANTGPGINIQDANNTLIGGSAANANYVAGNGGAAILILGTGAFSTTVSSNVIGLAKSLITDTLYLKGAGNTGAGLLISGGPQRTTVTSNTIASNLGAGVSVVGGTTLTTTINLNTIGWAADANSNPISSPNGSGIAISAAQGVNVHDNEVRYNRGDAIAVTDALTVTLLSNRLTDHTGNGVLVAGVSRNVQVLSNTIALNTGQATLVQGDSQRVRIQFNRMTRNAGGVVLQGSSIYTGSGTDPDTLTLPNHGIDPPIFNSASPLRFHLDQNGLVSGWVYTDTARISSCVPTSACRIQFFRSGANLTDGQGFIPLTMTPTGGASALDFATPDATGFFSGQLSSFLPLPKQLLFAITDGNGNTSEFGTLNVNASLSMAYLNPVNGQQDASPGQSIFYTLLLTNNGSVDLTGLHSATSKSLSRWGVSPPNGSASVFTMPANSTKIITVSMNLPVGTDISVRAGMHDTTLVTTAVTMGQSLLSLSQILTTTVLAAPVMYISRVASTGTAPPLGQVTHTYRYINSGNVAVTLDLAKSTVDPASSNSSIWLTTLSKNQITVGPDSSADVDVKVTVPQGAQVLDALGGPNHVTTYLTATAQVPFSSIQLVISDTAGVDLVPSAQMDGGGAPVSAQSLAEVDFFHNILNTSNGPATFCLNYRSNSGSQIVSFLSQNGVEIVNNCFTLETGGSPKSILRLHAVVKVTDKLLPGDSDSIRIYLTNPITGKEIANASATNTVVITVSPMIRQIWLPMVVK
jgi:parallel beta-helix repeat protein